MLPIIAQINLVSSAIGVAVSIVASFFVITLIASYYRFQHIVEQAEESDPEDMGSTAGEILRVQLARYLAGCARRNTSFCISLIHVENPGFHISMDSELVREIKAAVRCDDVVCLFDDETIALLTEAEPEDGENILNRVVKSVSGRVEGLLGDVVRVGISSYPGHGLSGKELIASAQDGLSQTSPEKPILLAEIIDINAEEEEHEDETEIEDVDEQIDVDDFESVTNEPERFDRKDPLEEKSKGHKAKRKDAILDPLTGVLKPSSVSAYMQRLMSDLRYKKKPASLFCVGVNNMEHIERFHGEDAADEVLVGVSKVLQDHLRSDDLIGRHEKYAFLVLAKCSLKEAENIGRRVSTLVQQSEFRSENKKLKTTITLGVAAHPEHGRNLHHLYTAGQKVLDYSRSNDIRAYAVYDPEIHDKVPAKPMRSIKSVQA
ncbi:MAG: diguanylate cyclase [Pontiellaceae bacterium]|nr:diguanylate cyclase [Pontiellaceae bacterium]MBN2785336.1 diguanylate cyclase [Pontiellaceae bacterium]